MKVLSITLALAALAASAPLNAQIATGRISTNSQGAGVNGSWTLVGRDGSGNQIYERRTRDSYGNFVVQRARRDANGNMTIISTSNVNGGYNNGNCSYNRSTNSVGDIIFGRSNANDCDDVNSRDDGAWYQVGRGPNNNSIYERRIQDGNGNWVIQRGRRNPNGTFTIIGTRGYGANDKQWKKAQKEQQKQLKKSQKEQEKEWKQAQKEQKNQMKHDNHR
jgi:hypothetical protein